MFQLIVCIIAMISVPLTVLFIPKIKIKNKQINTYYIIPLICTLILLVTRAMPSNYIWDGLTNNSSINPLKILILFFSMTFISIFLDEVGFFRYLANQTLKKAKSSQLKLFFLLYLIVSILTIFTSNDIVILTFTPFICFFAKNAKINPIPYLVAEFVGANTYSMALIIGNPTNIYIASFASINFLEYLKQMLIPTLMCGIVQIGLLYLVFRKQLNVKLDVIEQEVKIENKLGLISGIICLVSSTIMLSISSYIGLEMWYIAMGFALLLLIIFLIVSLLKKERLTILFKSLKRLPYELILFLIPMFIITLYLNYSLITEKLASFIGNNYPIIKYGFTSYLSANLINNIPMSVLFSNIIASSTLTSIGYYKAVYASIIGSNLGAILTPIGALAGIMWMSILKKEKINYSFIDFIKYGIIISLPSLAITLLGIFII